MGCFMCRVIYAVVLIAGLSGAVLAQNNTDQTSGNKNKEHGIAGRQAPIGHRQPTKKTLPADVWQHEQALPFDNQKFDRALIICKGC
jgi:hypothetical protein